MKNQKESKSNDRQYYKGEFFIVFYDKTGEEFLYMFDNVRDILRFQKKPITRASVNLINNMLYKALKTENHFVRFLTGDTMRVYIIQKEEETDE